MDFRVLCQYEQTWKKVGELNNQALFDGSSSLGESDGQIYTRFGDAPLKETVCR